MFSCQKIFPSISHEWLIITRYFSGEMYLMIDIEINKDLEFEAKYGVSAAAAIHTHLNEAALQTWSIRHAPLFH